jgi:transcriptional regulator with XRE-family HTH domain
MRKIIGERLEEERVRLGKKKGEMAAIGGVAGSAYTNYLEGNRAPDAEFLALIAAAGADVQYILTGQRSSSALAPDEQALLAGYRALDARGKAGVFGVIGGLTQPAEKTGKFIVHGDIGQNFDAPVKGGTFTVDMRKERKKKE